MLTLLLYVAVILAVALLAWRWQPVEQEEPTEFGATFDALQAEKDAAAKRLVRTRAHEEAQRAAGRMIAQAQYGPIRDGHEV